MDEVALSVTLLQKAGRERPLVLRSQYFLR